MSCAFSRFVTLLTSMSVALSTSFGSESLNESAVSLPVFVEVFEPVFSVVGWSVIPLVHLGDSPMVKRMTIDAKPANL